MPISILEMIAWNICCGLAQTESQLLAFRFLAGLGGSAPLSVRLKFINYRVSDLNGFTLQVGGGVLGDCWRPEERGRAFALYSLAPLIGAVVGPITGAWSVASQVQ